MAENVIRLKSLVTASQCKLAISVSVYEHVGLDELIMVPCSLRQFAGACDVDDAEPPPM